MHTAYLNQIIYVVIKKPSIRTDAIVDPVTGCMDVIALAGNNQGAFRVCPSPPENIVADVECEQHKIGLELKPVHLQ